MNILIVGSGLLAVIKGPFTTKVTKQTKNKQLHWQYLVIIFLVTPPSDKQPIYANNVY